MNTIDTFDRPRAIAKGHPATMELRLTQVQTAKYGRPIEAALLSIDKWRGPASEIHASHYFDQITEEHVYTYRGPKASIEALDRFVASVDHQMRQAMARQD